MNPQPTTVQTPAVEFTRGAVASNGETDLALLLAAMQPILHDEVYVFCALDQQTYAALSFAPLGVFREREGVTVIVAESQARDSGLPFDAPWAHIELTVHSSLSAVGFIAAISRKLAQAGISVNVVAAYYHDHLFVPWASRWQALDLLQELSRSQHISAGDNRDNP